MRIQPLSDRVVVRRIKQEDTARNGIFIPDVARETEKRQEAEVLAIGPGKRIDGELIPIAVAVGDRVMLGDYTGTEIKVDGEELLILREDEILGIVTVAKSASK